MKAQDFPEPQQPPRLVNDFAGVLSDKEEHLLETRLVAFDDSSSTQISIVTIETTGGYDVSGYAFQLAEKWGIGRKDKDNGVLILVVVGDQEVFIATGYGVEDVLTDALSRRIIENNMLPHFKHNEFYAGLESATNVIMGLIAGKFTAEDVGGKEMPGVLLFLIALLVIFVLLSRIFRKRSRFYDYTGRGRTISHGPVWWGGGFGGRGVGGFSGGGGFGGFGGGSFGGGGAGGRW